MFHKGRSGLETVVRIRNAIISIRRFLGSPAGQGLQETRLRLRTLLSEGIDERSRWGPEFATLEFDRNARAVVQRLDAENSPLALADAAAAGLEVFEQQTRQAARHFREQSGHMHSMVAMLTRTVADIAGQSDESVARLRAVERQIERASSLDDMRELKGSLQVCLAAVREAAVQQRNGSQTTVERLRDHVRKAAHPLAEAAGAGLPANRASREGRGAEYVAAFRLQRADRILTRFGAPTVEQMVAVIGEGLKPALGAHDRLVPWKGSSFVMFLRSPEAVAAIQRRLSAAVARIAQRYVEAGGRSALLAVMADWALFPQAEYPSLDAVLAEVDAFSGGKAGNGEKQE